MSPRCWCRDYQQVRAGQVLARIDDRIYAPARRPGRERSLAAQQATLANSASRPRAAPPSLQAQEPRSPTPQAQLLRAQADMARVNDLVTDGSVSLRERDQTLAALRQAQAGVLQAKAAREIARQDIRTVEVGRGGLEAGGRGAASRASAGPDRPCQHRSSARPRTGGWAKSACGWASMSPPASS